MVKLPKHKPEAASECVSNGQRCSHVPGFTLIELLVVVAIISLLVSILLPTLNQAKFLAKSAVCLSNNHTMGLGLGMYGGDYDGQLPPYSLGMYRMRKYTGSLPLAGVNEVEEGLRSMAPLYVPPEMLYCPDGGYRYEKNWDKGTWTRWDYWAYFFNRYSSRRALGEPLPIEEIVPCLIVDGTHYTLPMHHLKDGVAAVQNQLMPDGSGRTVKRDGNGWVYNEMPGASPQFTDPAGYVLPW